MKVRALTTAMTARANPGDLPPPAYVRVSGGTHHPGTWVELGPGRGTNGLPMTWGSLFPGPGNYAFLAYFWPIFKFTPKSESLGPIFQNVELDPEEGAKQLP